eukprot:Hpha_TRINITY_DN15665_c2_g1::TRINITY_DN15665_c2_g1_i3::g.99277::m.99277
MGSPGGLSPAAEALWEQLKDVDLKKKEDNDHLALVVEGGGEYDGVYYRAAENFFNGRPYWQGAADGKVMYWSSMGWRIGGSLRETIRQHPIVASNLFGCESITECNGWVDSHSYQPMPVKIVPYTRHPKIMLHLQQRTQCMEAQLSFVVSWVARAVRQEMAELEGMENRRRAELTEDLASQHAGVLQVLASAFAREVATVELEGEERLAREGVLLEALSTVQAAGRSIVGRVEASDRCALERLWTSASPLFREPVIQAQRDAAAAVTMFLDAQIAVRQSCTTPMMSCTTPDAVERRNLARTKATGALTRYVEELGSARRDAESLKREACGFEFSTESPARKRRRRFSPPDVREGFVRGPLPAPPRGLPPGGEAEYVVEALCCPSPEAELDERRGHPWLDSLLWRSDAAWHEATKQLAWYKEGVAAASGCGESLGSLSGLRAEVTRKRRRVRNLREDIEDIDASQEPDAELDLMTQIAEARRELQEASQRFQDAAALLWRAAEDHVPEIGGALARIALGDAQFSDTSAEVGAM